MNTSLKTRPASAAGPAAMISLQVLEMHAQDAAARGIASGSIVRVFNLRGDYRVKAQAA